MPAEHSTRRRVIYFDILRIVAIFFVVFVHLAAQHWADVDVSSRAWFAFNLYCTINFSTLQRSETPIY